MNIDSLPTADSTAREIATESDIDAVYLTQSEPEVAQIAIPSGQDVVTFPVIGGSTIRLPFSDDELSARLGTTNGNLAIRSGGTTIILLGYADALDEGGVTILDAAGNPVDVAATIASTDADIDIPTAAGPSAGDLGTGVDNTGGVFTPFDPLDGIGGLEAVGGLEATALTYSVIELEIVAIVEDDEADIVVDDTDVPDTISPINYNDANSGEENFYRDTNVMVVLDISGSMKEDANNSLAGVQSRMSIAKAVLANLLHTYDTLGDVRVTVVVFNEGAAVHFAWGSVADAIASFDSLLPADRTNYAAALEAAEAAWGGGGKLTGDTENVIYFLSDGKPTFGGGPGNHLTAAQKVAWNDFLENAGNGIDHVYAVGIGDDIGSDANPDPDLADVAQPDGNNLPPGEVIYVNDPAADLAEELIGTIEGASISGNVLSGLNTSQDGDNALPGQADADGDGNTYIYTLSYTGEDPAFDVEFAWDGASNSLTQVGGGGQNVSANDLEISFDTEYGRMTFDFATGSYIFTPGAVSEDTSVSFHYGTRDADGDVDEAGGIDGDGPAGGADLVISIIDTPDTPQVSLASAEIIMADAGAPLLSNAASDEQMTLMAAN